MDDPLQKILLNDAEFARLSTDEKFAYIQKVLRALAIEEKAKPGGAPPDSEASKDRTDRK